MTLDRVSKDGLSRKEAESGRRMGVGSMRDVCVVWEKVFPIICPSAQNSRWGPIAFN